MVSLKNLDCILLVDDDVICNFLHEKVLNTAGYENHIEIALNGKIALDYLNDSYKNPKDKNHPLPKLILLDINMPVMDCWEFLDAFNTLDKKITKDINIVMLTSSIDPNDITKAKKIEILKDFTSKALTIKKMDHIFKSCSIRA